MPEAEFVKPKNFFTLFTIINITIFITVIVSNFYFFYFRKNFQFLVETSCDKSKEQCFERDCTNPDDCPPNGLSVFKRYSLKASDFQYCKDENCQEACESGQIKCTQVKCIKDSETGWQDLCFNKQ